MCSSNITILQNLCFLFLLYLFLLCLFSQCIRKKKEVKEREKEKEKKASAKKEETTPSTKSTNHISHFKKLFIFQTCFPALYLILFIYLFIFFNLK